MVPAKLFTIAFLVLMLWRFVFAGIHRRPSVRPIAPHGRRHNNRLEEGLHISAPGCVVGIAANCSENSPDGLDHVDRKDRAKSYLRRVVALTAAAQMDNGYVLNVGTTRFHVRDRYVRRLRDMTYPECAYEETCFYPLHKSMPKEEDIATALLHLRNNPAVFDRWAAQNGLAFKADGQVFTPARSDFGR
jgi:hypothetical protein